MCLQACVLYAVSAAIAANLTTTPTTFAQQAEPAAQTESTESTNEAAAASNEAATPSKSPKLKHDRFLRIRKDERDRSMALETSIVRYEKVTEDNTRITVDLIGAVHVGHAEYYEQLNKQFEKYEVLLYELVAPEGTVIPKGGRAPGESGVPTSPVAALQMGMKSVLELEFQLELIGLHKRQLRPRRHEPRRVRREHGGERRKYRWLRAQGNRTRHGFAGGREGRRRDRHADGVVLKEQSGSHEAIHGQANGQYGSRHDYVRGQERFDHSSITATQNACRF